MKRFALATLGVAAIGLSLTWAGNKAPEPAETAASVLDKAAGVTPTLWAIEPMLLSPSSIDIDDKGRVWVAEIANYRGSKKSRPEGDRILILEDTKGDGKADKVTVFYQGTDINSPHGVCVLPTANGKNTKVIVSAGSSVFVFTDKDGDGKSDDKKVMFSKICREQHDHGIHAFMFGPDGKLYFNYGNSGQRLADAAGNTITDLAGNKVETNRKPYQQGMAFRCDLDGSNVDTLGWNFRNNWEVTVDSFGAVWQSDNDDDGNKGVRINFVMEYGNYGYRDEMTGKGWKTKRTDYPKERARAHFYQNSPGTMPNLIETGQGSPTGILVYEGDLLPKQFQGQMIHCDAGPNVVRAYPVTDSGAGYKATIVNVLKGSKDKWFRPSDVSVAPDGALFVADWNDRGVGGHRAGDLKTGRLFRVAPSSSKASVPKQDYSTAAGAAKALLSPNLATRYIAWTTLHGMGTKAEAELKKVWASSNPRHRARALWLLGKIKGKAATYVKAAIADKDANIRMTGIRLARQTGVNVIDVVTALLKDPSPQVRRECLIAMTLSKSSKVPALWTKLAVQHTAGDRWMTEALGIAARKREAECFDGWLKAVGTKWDTPAGRDIIWRSRAPKAMTYLAKIVSNAKNEDGKNPRYMRAFDFHPKGPAKDKALQEASGL